MLLLHSALLPILDMWLTTGNGLWMPVEVLELLVNVGFPIRMYKLIVLKFFILFEDELPRF